MGYRNREMGLASFDEADRMSVVLKLQQFQWRRIVPNLSMYLLSIPIDYSASVRVAE